MFQLPASPLQGLLVRMGWGMGIQSIGLVLATEKNGMKILIKESLKSLFDPFFSMMFCMFSNVGKQFQIFYSIITMNIINMMNNFFRSKITSDMFFHYKTMFKDITGFMCIRMVRIFYKDVSSLLGTFTTIPIMMIFSSGERCFNLIFPFFRHISFFPSPISRVSYMSFTHSNSVIIGCPSYFSGISHFVFSILRTFSTYSKRISHFRKSNIFSMFFCKWFSFKDTFWHKLFPYCL